MKKLFVVMPIKGLDKNEIREKQWQTVERVREICPEEAIILITDGSEPAETALGRLCRSIELMAEADAVYFCKDWDKDRECKILWDCAIKYDIGLVIDGSYYNGR